MIGRADDRVVGRDAPANDWIGKQVQVAKISCRGVDASGNRSASDVHLFADLRDDLNQFPRPGLSVDAAFTRDAQISPMQSVAESGCLDDRFCAALQRG